MARAATLDLLGTVRVTGIRFGDEVPVELAGDQLPMLRYMEKLSRAGITARGERSTSPKSITRITPRRRDAPS